MGKKIISVAMFVFLFGCNASSEKSDNKMTDLIYIDKESTQCNQNGLSLSDTFSQLTNEGISIKSSQCGILTGIAVTSMCGADDLQINIHKINHGDTKKSLKLGFKLISDLDKKGMGYKITKCNK